jgi:pimeloyl-ACP methyl ester carboxylesterase
LSEHFRVLAFDRPGYGHSGRGDGLAGPAAQARLIHGALSRLGIERPILVGHSWSGALVLHYGLEYPTEVAGIVSLAGWSFAAHQASLKLLSLLSQSAVEPVMGMPFGPKLARHMAARALERVFAPNPVPPGYAALPIELMIRPGQLRANADDLHALNPDILAIQRQYRHFRVPLEILVASQDGVVEPRRHGRRLAALVPGARLTELAATGHMLHHVHPEALVAAVSRLRTG